MDAAPESDLRGTTRNARGRRPSGASGPASPPTAAFRQGWRTLLRRSLSLRGGAGPRWPSEAFRPRKCRVGSAVPRGPVRTQVGSGLLLFSGFGIDRFELGHPRRRGFAGLAGRSLAEPGSSGHLSAVSGSRPTVGRVGLEERGLGASCARESRLRPHPVDPDIPLIGTQRWMVESDGPEAQSASGPTRGGRRRLRSREGSPNPASASSGNPCGFHRDSTRRNDRPATDRREAGLGGGLVTAPCRVGSRPDRPVRQHAQDL